mmetsp:Transcript_36852/g.98719  ORF Transcript_36852/g.98719 Transcript_36852/m.98719 type:complete len:83 (+) Transcript_36852:249-497(+)
MHSHLARGRVRARLPHALRCACPSTGSRDYRSEVCGFEEEEKKASTMGAPVAEQSGVEDIGGPSILLPREDSAHSMIDAILF